MDEPTLLREDRGQVRWLTLNRPQLHNAFDDVLITELDGAVKAAGDDPAVRVVVLAGAGKSFCAGADLAWMKRMVGVAKDENFGDARRLGQLYQTIDRCPKPVIARVHGSAYGGGAGLVAVADLAVATPSASFAFAEVKLGLVPAVISPYVVARIGPSQARRMFLLATPFDAHTAERIGFVHQLASQDELDDAIDGLATTLCTNGPEALRTCKELVRMCMAGDATLDSTARVIAERRASAEGQEGMAAFLEKRPPAWRKA